MQRNPVFELQYAGADEHHVTVKLIERETNATTRIELPAGAASLRELAKQLLLIELREQHVGPDVERTHRLAVVAEQRGTIGLALLREAAEAEGVGELHRVLAHPHRVEVEEDVVHHRIGAAPLVVRVGVAEDGAPGRRPADRLIDPRQ